MEIKTDKKTGKKYIYKDKEEKKDPNAIYPDTTQKPVAPKGLTCVSNNADVFLDDEGCLYTLEEARTPNSDRRLVKQIPQQ